MNPWLKIGMSVTFLGCALAHAKDPLSQWIEDNRPSALSPPPVLRQLGQVEGVSVYEVGQSFVSAPEQNLVAWLKDLGPSARRWTQSTNWETCAQVCYSSSSRQYAIELQTAQSALFCATMAPCPPGFEVVAGKVHTHPDHAVATPDQAANAVFSDLPSVVWLQPNQLSPEDLASGEVWMWAPSGQLWHADLKRGLHPHHHDGLPSILFPCPYDKSSFVLK